MSFVSQLQIRIEIGVESCVAHFKLIYMPGAWLINWAINQRSQVVTTTSIKLNFRFLDRGGHKNGASLSKCGTQPKCNEISIRSIV